MSKKQRNDWATASANAGGTIVVSIVVIAIFFFAVKVMGISLHDMASAYGMN